MMTQAQRESYSQYRKQGLTALESYLCSKVGSIAIGIVGLSVAVETTYMYSNRGFNCKTRERMRRIVSIQPAFRPVFVALAKK